jgi:capsular exopolysaccharide synthesis family protein
MCESRFLSRSGVIYGIVSLTSGADLSQGRSRIFQELPSLTGANGGMDRPTSRANHDQLLPIFWRQRWLIVFVTFLCVAAGVAYLMIATPVYTSTARILIRPAASRMSQDSFSDPVNANYLYTEADLMQSPSVLSLAAQLDDVKKVVANEPDPIQFLQKYMGVEVGKRSAGVTVSFSSTNAQDAANIANGIVTAYQKYQITPSSSQDAEIKALNEEVKKIEKRIQSTSEAMTKLEEQYGALDPLNPHNTLAEQKVRELSSQFDAARRDTLKQQQASQTAYKIIEDLKIRGVDTNVVDIDMLGLGADAEAKLPGEINTLKQAIASSPYGEKHPNKQNMVLRLNRLELTLAKLVLNHYQLAEALEKDLKQSLAEARIEAANVSVASSRYARLQTAQSNDETQKHQIQSRLNEILRAQELGIYNIDVYEVAKREIKPSHPAKKTTLPIALVLGLILGGGLGFLRDWTDDRYRSVEEIKDSMAMPLLGTVPQMPDGLPAALAGQQAMLEPTSAIAEACRTIRTAVYFGAPKDRCRTILVTSPASSDGKSTIASNLAITMAQAGKRVLIVDADLRLPTQHAIFGVRQEFGLSSVLDGKATLDQAVQPTAVSGLEILPCGPKPSNPSEMLNSPMFGELLEVLSERFDQVIIDSPPVMGIADARIIGAACDVTVLVLRAEKSTRRVSELARDGLGSVGANLLGMIINEVEPSQGYAYGYHGYTRAAEPKQMAVKGTTAASSAKIQQN